MQRLHVSLALSGAVLLAAVLAPDLTPLAEPRAAAPPPAPSLDDAPRPAATHTGTLTARAALDQSVRHPGDRERFLVIELTADELEAAVRSAVHTTVVVDTSGSMTGDGKIDYARQALHTLVSQLSADDSFSLVQFDSTASVLQPLTSARHRAQFTARIDALIPSGGTSITPGLALGYQQLQATESGTRRLVLLSDGLSSETPGDLARLAGQWSEQGITASAFGLGLDFDERLLSAVADAGGGRYRYVDDPTHLASLLTEELDNMGRVAARGVEVEVSLDGASPTRVYGYETHDGRRTLDGYTAYIGDMTSGQTRKVVARLDLEDRAGLSDLAEVTIRFTDPVTGAPQQTTLTLQAALSADPALVTASQDARAGRHAARALAGVVLSEGIDLWRSGDNAAARSVLTQGEATLSAMITRHHIRDLDDALLAIRQRTESLDRVSATSRQGRSEFLGEQLRALGYIE